MFTANKIKWSLLFTFLLTIAMRLLENAVIGWGDDKIAEKLGITSPSVQQVVDFIIKWGIPFTISALIIAAVFALGKMSEKSRHAASSLEPKSEPSQSPEAKLVSFPALIPKEGKGKFRARGEPLGIHDSDIDRFVGQQNRPTEVRMMDNSIMWIRVMPVFEPNRTWQITDLKEKMRSRMIAPIHVGHGGLNYIISEDGYGIYEKSVNEHSAMGIVYIFTNGEIWSISSTLLSAKIIPHFLEQVFCNALKQYAQFLSEQMQISGDYKWIAGVENIKGAGLYYPAPPGRQWQNQGPQGICLTNEIVKEGTYSLGEPPMKSLEPFFVELFDKCGVKRPEYLNELM